ncbi:hypothetical protein [Microbulbifer halophilus]|uniref:hypothetical protein n=1 Tax=Microbulbifer halophilus TaxID=453963 RepID=UPI00360F4C4A
MRQIRLFKAVYIKPKRVRARKVSEFIGRHPHLRGDVFEEVRHRAGARLEEIPHSVGGVLENVGQLILLDADALGGEGEALEILYAGVGHIGKIFYFLRIVNYARGHYGQCTSGDRGSCSKCFTGSPNVSFYLLAPFLSALFCFPHTLLEAAYFGDEIQGQCAE